MNESENPQQKVIRLLNRQRGQLQAIRGLNYKHAEFKAWYDATFSILQRSLGPTSQHTIRFRDTRFSGPSQVIPWGRPRPPHNYISPQDAAAFQRGCDTTEASLKAAIDEVTEFGLYSGEAKPAVGRGRGSSVNQTFHAPVTMNQAIATDSAVQRIGRVGDKTGADLKEISDLLQQSQDLSPNQVRQGVVDIEALASEFEKPEAKRDWKSILERGNAILELTNKATDIAEKLAPYTPAIFTLMDQAKHWIK